MTPEQEHSLRRDGFVLLPDLVPRPYADALRARGLDVVEQEARAGNPMPSAWEGMLQVRQMLGRGEIFERAAQHRGVLDAVGCLLGVDCVLTACTFNVLQPGARDLGLHVDWPISHLPTPRPTEALLASCIWFLDDFFPLNGATSVLPGSHLRRHDLPQPGLEYPDEAVVSGRKGSVLVVNSAAWHGSSANRSPHPRVALITYYRRRTFEVPEFRENALLLPQERLTPALRRLLGM